MSQRKLSKERKRRYRRLLMAGRPWIECHYCGCRLTLLTLTLEHVMPLSMGGAMGIKNIVAACRACNLARGNQSYTQFVRSIAV